MAIRREHRFTRAPRTTLRTRLICWVEGHKFEWFFDTWYKTKWAICAGCGWVYPENQFDAGLKGWIAKRAPKYTYMVEAVTLPENELPERPMPY